MQVFNHTKRNDRAYMTRLSQ